MIVVVAGMEGALPSVVAGLTSRPVIAVPTSVGYGASFGGIAALLGMLNSCAAGVTVVNIDNGFGAGYAASLINRKTDPMSDLRGCELYFDCFSGIAGDMTARGAARSRRARGGGARRAREAAARRLSADERSGCGAAR